MRHTLVEFSTINGYYSYLPHEEPASANFVWAGTGLSGLDRLELWLDRGGPYQNSGYPVEIRLSDSGYLYGSEDDPDTPVVVALSHDPSSGAGDILAKRVNDHALKIYQQGYGGGGKAARRLVGIPNRLPSPERIVNGAGPFVKRATGAPGAGEIRVLDGTFALTRPLVEADDQRIVMLFATMSDGTGAGDVDNATLGDNAGFPLQPILARNLRAITSSPLPAPQFSVTGSNTQNLFIPLDSNVIGIIAPSHGSASEDGTSRLSVYYAGRSVGVLSAEVAADGEELVFAAGTDLSELAVGDTLYINPNPASGTQAQTAIETVEVTEIDDVTVTVERGTGAGVVTVNAGISVHDRLTYGIGLRTNAQSGIITLDADLL